MRGGVNKSDEKLDERLQAVEAELKLALETASELEERKLIPLTLQLEDTQKELEKVQNDHASDLENFLKEQETCMRELESSESRFKIQESRILELEEALRAKAMELATGCKGADEANEKLEANRDIHKNELERLRLELDVMTVRVKEELEESDACSYTAECLIQELTAEKALHQDLILETGRYKEDIADLEAQLTAAHEIFIASKGDLQDENSDVHAQLVTLRGRNKGVRHRGACGLLCRYFNEASSKVTRGILSHWRLTATVEGWLRVMSEEVLKLETGHEIVTREVFKSNTHSTYQRDPDTEPNRHMEGGAGSCGSDAKSDS